MVKNLNGWVESKKNIILLNEYKTKVSNCNRRQKTFGKIILYCTKKALALSLPFVIANQSLASYKLNVQLCVGQEARPIPGPGHVTVWWPVSPLCEHCFITMLLCIILQWSLEFSFIWDPLDYLIPNLWISELNFTFALDESESDRKIKYLPFQNCKCFIIMN